MGLYCRIKGKFGDVTLIGHLPGEKSRFCKFYLKNNGEVGATALTSTKFLLIVEIVEMLAFSLPRVVSK